jgi:hypothetical protein
MKQKYNNNDLRYMKVKLPVLLLASIYGRIGTVNPCFMPLPYGMDMKISVALTL